MDWARQREPAAERFWAVLQTVSPILCSTLHYHRATSQASGPAFLDDAALTALLSAHP